MGERTEPHHAPEPVHLPHVGMRKLKSMLAVFVAFWIWQPVRLVFPDLEVHPLFIYIYALIEIRNSSEKTVNLGKERIKATFVALGLGLPMIALSEWLESLVQPAWAHTAIELVTLLLGILLALSVAQLVGCRTLGGLSAAIFIILVVSYATSERYLYAVLRASQTIAGVFVAWLINVWLLPYPNPRRGTPPAEVREDPTAHAGDAAF